MTPFAEAEPLEDGVMPSQRTRRQCCGGTVAAASAYCCAVGSQKVTQAVSKRHSAVTRKKVYRSEVVQWRGPAAVLLPGQAIGQLTQNIGVANVTGGLLDHV